MDAGCVCMWWSGCACIMNSVCVRDKFTARVYWLGGWRGSWCVCVFVSERKEQWPEKVLMSAGGQTDALQRERNCVCVCVTLRSCLNPLSLSNNEEGRGGVTARLLLGSPLPHPLVCQALLNSAAHLPTLLSSPLLIFYLLSLSTPSVKMTTLTSLKPVL